MVKNRFVRFARRVAVVGLAVVAAACGGGPPIVFPPAPHMARVAQWSRFEATYVPSRTPQNPFDPNEIDVRAQFVEPDGAQHEALGFWYQDYDRRLVDGREQLTPKGSPSFRVRFTPAQPGRWQWRWVLRTPGHTEVRPWHQFNVTPARGHGILRVSDRDPRMLAFDDRTSYFAIGENTGWYDQRGTYAYDDWFGALAAQHANFGRVWMASWAFGIEWEDTGLGNYAKRLDRAWRLDHVFAEAERRDIYVMLTLLNHGAFSTVFNSEWANNPYNVANGGPLTAPSEFFTNATARYLFAQRLRYIVARWGSSTHLLAWELWNEVDLTDGYASAAVAAWHADMSARLRALDPYDHLVTTSHAIFVNDPDVWRGGGLDFTQLHFYANTLPPFANVPRTVVTFTRDRLAQTGAPVLFGELGIDSRGPVETTTNDPQGIGVHDGLWAGAVSGGTGTAMPWWWDSVIAAEPQRYYPMFGAIARFVDGVRWDREAFAPLTGEVSNRTRPVVPYGLRGAQTLLLWLKDDGFQWNTPEDQDISGATLEVDGRWCGRWYDTWDGAWLDDVTFDGTVTVPTFRRDLALRARRC
jgi:Domain of unknown function (DUF5060)/Cellulase (glycosyl hydrolase family 5)